MSEKIEFKNLVIELLNFGYWIIELLNLYMYTLIITTQKAMDSSDWIDY